MHITSSLYLVVNISYFQVPLLILSLDFKRKDLKNKVPYMFVTEEKLFITAIICMIFQITTYKCNNEKDENYYVLLTTKQWHQ